MTKSSMDALEHATTSMWRPSEYMLRTVRVLKAISRSGATPLLIGPPGTGKTSVVEWFAREEGAHLSKLTPSSQDPTDVSGIPVRSEELDDYGNVILSTRKGAPGWAVNTILECPLQKDGTRRPAVIFMDEFNTGTPLVQASWLTLLGSRETETFKFGDHVIFVAAMNDEDVATNGGALSPAMANRMSHIEWDPPVTDFLTGLQLGWGRENMSEGEIAARSRITSYLRQNVDEIHVFPEGYVEQSKAWPSRRTWEYAARSLGELQDESRLVRASILASLVGERAAALYLNWEETMNLPDPDEVLKDPTAQHLDLMPKDRVFAILGGAIAWAGAVGLDDHYDGLIDLLIHAAERDHEDVAAAYIPNVTQNLPKGMRVPTRLIERFRDFITAS